MGRKRHSFIWLRVENHKHPEAENSTTITACLVSTTEWAGSSAPTVKPLY